MAPLVVLPLWAEIAIAPLPFLFELVGDYLLIRAGRKDIPFAWRVVLLVALWLVAGLGVCLLATALFCFFDPALNKLRGKKWYYQSTTNGKLWDRLLASLNHWFVLTGRVAVFVAFVVTYYYIWV